MLLSYPPGTGPSWGGDIYGVYIADVEMYRIWSEWRREHPVADEFDPELMRPWDPFRNGVQRVEVEMALEDLLSHPYVSLIHSVWIPMLLNELAEATPDVLDCDVSETGDRSSIETLLSIANARIRKLRERRAAQTRSYWRNR